LIDYYLNSVDGDLCKELSPKEIMFKSVYLKGHVMIKIGEHSWNVLILDNFIVKCSVIYLSEGRISRAIDQGNLAKKVMREKTNIIMVQKDHLFDCDQMSVNRNLI
jgi:hypothetical protein